MLTAIKRWIGINPIKWVQNTLLMRRRVQEFIKSNNAGLGTQNIGVVVTPWNGTSIPWYSLVIGLMLSKAGSRVDFLIDDHRFGRNWLRYKFVIYCIKYVIKPLKRKFTIIELSTVRGEDTVSETTMEFIENLAKQNATWELRGEVAGTERESIEFLYTKQFLQAYRSISQSLSRIPYNLIFIPGGVWGTSGIWSKVAADAGIRIGSYDDGGTGIAMFAGNGIACQMQDIPLAFNELRTNMSEPLMAFVRGEAMAEMDKRRLGVDIWQYQVKDSATLDGRYDGAVMVALNSSWDSAALGLHAIFKDNADWIVQTVRHLLDQTKATVVVRQHPAERLEIARSSDNYREMLFRNFGGHPRLYFIAADDKVNSYELMSKIGALVVYTSTIGIEAAVNGIPVITASNSYYSELGFIYKANDLKIYHNFLTRATTGDLPVTAEMKDRAMLGYYLTQCCNWVHSEFNPAQFHLWSKRSIDKWYGDKSVAVIMETLRSGSPVACVNHQKNWERSTESRRNRLI